MSIKIILYDDNEALRGSIESLLVEHDEFSVIAMSNAETVENDIAQLKPDVILMDIDMPNVNGVQAVKRIRKIRSELPVVMLTVFDDNENIFNAICAGASGYLLKANATLEIVDAIKDVFTGGAPMTSTIARKVLKMLPTATTKEEEEKADLSYRETQILRLLVQGFSYKMIASEIKISHDTVRFYIKKIYDKLHVHSATQAVSKAIKDKLV